MHDDDGEVVRVRIERGEGEQETIVATGRHPFMVVEGEASGGRPRVEALPLAERLGDRGGRWTEARRLRVGDRLRTPVGVSASIVGLQVTIERLRVYNLTVLRLHSDAVAPLRRRAAPLHGRRSG